MDDDHVTSDSSETTSSPESSDDAASRRGFLSLSASAVMFGGMAAGYGTLAWQAGSFLYPVSTGKGLWHFVCTLDQLELGQAMPFTLPSGAQVVIARQTEGDTADAFVALSSICPHLGCQVFWEAVNDRFFCPCHNGAFDASGVPTEGPPKAANQHLTRFPLQVQGNLLMIEIPLESVEVPKSGRA